MVYLLHFSKNLHHARHYIGFCEDRPENPKKRIERHKRGDGSKLVKAVVESGIKINIVRTWPGKDRHFERGLKRQKNSHRYCPVCRKGE